MVALANPPAWPSGVQIDAKSGIVIDADSGAILFQQEGIDTASPPASITKLLTALIVLEHCDLSDTITFSETAMNSVEADSGNKLSLVIGDQMTVEDCLYTLLLVSINQSANALAEYTAGSIPAFVDMMNEKAAELGCSDKTHFENPSGLNGENQQVTAYDMALIAQAAFANEELLKISSTLSYQIPASVNHPDGISFRQEHRLLTTADPNDPLYYPPAVAGKTGYLLKAGNTLVTYGEKDGRRLISVILRGNPKPKYFLDGKNLLEFGFNNFQNLSISDHETRYITGNDLVELNGRTYQPSDLIIEPDKVITLPKEASFEDASLALAPPSADAPINAVAVLNYTYEGHFVGQAFLMASQMSVSDSTANANTDIPANSEEEYGNSVDSLPNDSKFPGQDIPLSSVIAIVAAISAIALMAFSIAWLTYSRKKEAKELARRRELRRQRLRASGDESEFERLLELRKAKDNR